jgi:hypothetical protein
VKLEQRVAAETARRVACEAEAARLAVEIKAAMERVNQLERSGSAAREEVESLRLAAAQWTREADAREANLQVEVTAEFDNAEMARIFAMPASVGLLSSPPTSRYRQETDRDDKPMSLVATHDPPELARQRDLCKPDTDTDSRSESPVSILNAHRPSVILGEKKELQTPDRQLAASPLGLFRQHEAMVGSGSWQEFIDALVDEDAVTNYAETDGFDTQSTSAPLAGPEIGGRHKSAAASLDSSCAYNSHNETCLSDAATVRMSYFEKSEARDSDASLRVLDTLNSIEDRASLWSELQLLRRSEDRLRTELHEACIRLKEEEARRQALESEVLSQHLEQQLEREARRHAFERATVLTTGSGVAATLACADAQSKKSEHYSQLAGAGIARTWLKAKTVSSSLSVSCSDAIRHDTCSTCVVLAKLNESLRTQLQALRPWKPDANSLPVVSAT